MGGGGYDKNWVGGGSTGGIFPGGGNEQTFSSWEGPPPIFPSRRTNIYIYIYVYIYMYIYICIYIYIYTIVLAYVLIPLANHNSVIFFVSQGTEKLNKLPQAHKKP